MYGSSDVQGAGTRGTTGHEMRTIQRAGFLSIVGNVVLFGIQLAAGLTSGSIARWPMPGSHFHEIITWIVPAGEPGTALKLGI